jgi:hypothetical protein
MSDVSINVPNPTPLRTAINNAIRKSQFVLNPARNSVMASLKTYVNIPARNSRPNPMKLRQLIRFAACCWPRLNSARLN